MAAKKTKQIVPVQADGVEAVTPLPHNESAVLTQETMINDILDIIQNSLHTAKEQPTVNNLNIVVKGFNALKLAQALANGRKSRRSAQLIEKKIREFIDAELTGVQSYDEPKKDVNSVGNE